MNDTRSPRVFDVTIYPASEPFAHFWLRFLLVFASREGISEYEAFQATAIPDLGVFGPPTSEIRPAVEIRRIYQDAEVDSSAAREDTQYWPLLSIHRLISSLQDLAGDAGMFVAVMGPWQGEVRISDLSDAHCKITVRSTQGAYCGKLEEDWFPQNCKRCIGCSENLEFVEYCKPRGPSIIPDCLQPWANIVLAVIVAAPLVPLFMPFVLGRLVWRAISRRRAVAA